MVQEEQENSFILYNIYNSIFNMYFELAHAPDTGDYIPYPATFTSIPSNTYLITMEDSLVCRDSLAFTITEPDSIYSITNLTVCNSTVWNWVYHATSGTYSSILTAANGCDSNAILNLVVNYSDTSFTSLTSCDPVVWNGSSYSSSGTYYYNNLINLNSCDSVAALNFTIYTGDSTNTSVTACDSYTWIDGNTYTSGVYINSFTNLNGCDSIVTLDLSINYFCLGCTDSLANNYNPFSIADNGTCLYSSFVFGCTDTSALNYDLLATIDDSSCCYNSGQLWSQIGQDIDGEFSNDQSGSSVSISSDGSIVAIGSPNNGGPGSNAGHVRVFERDQICSLPQNITVTSPEDGIFCFNKCCWR